MPHKLVIVGRREGLITADTRVQALAAELGDRVTFTGFVDDAALKSWVANADLLVQPSFYEGFGLPPLEAMAAGCPVAVSDIPVLREVCGDAAAYFDPLKPEDIASQVVNVLQDKEFRSRLRRQGKIRARSLRWETCVSQTCALLAQMLTCSARTAPVFQETLR